MGIPIGGKGRKRRSYADYRPPKANTGPRNDPFRIVFYLVIIVGAGWIYFNPITFQEQVVARLPKAAEEPVGGPLIGPTLVPTADPSQVEELAREAYLNGQFAAAIDYYKQANAIDPNNPIFPFEMARLTLYSSGLYSGETREEMLDAAFDAANLAVLANPERPEGYAIAGKILDWQGQPEAGLNQVQLALEIDPEFALAHSYLAEIQVDLDRWDQALETIQVALSLDPNSEDIRRDYAYVLESLGDYNSALAQYEAALALQPKVPFMLMAQGRNYRQVGLYNEAIDSFFKAEALQPDSPRIQFEVALTYESFIGDPNSAVSFYEKAVELDETYGVAWGRIGSIYYFQENYAQAAPALEQAIALGVEGTELYIRLGIAYAELGQCGQATTFLTEAYRRAEDDEQLIDVINYGFDLCSLPTPEPFSGTESGDSEP